MGTGRAKYWICLLLVLVRILNGIFGIQIHEPLGYSEIVVGLVLSDCVFLLLLLICWHLLGVDCLLHGLICVKWRPGIAFDIQEINF